MTQQTTFSLEPNPERARRRGQPMQLMRDTRVRPRLYRLYGDDHLA
ncbi:hypothetical protein ACU4GD_29925 [Cupriavidus basilensis]